jgi:hypothetical protein
MPINQFGTGVADDAKAKTLASKGLITDHQLRREYTAAVPAANITLAITLLQTGSFQSFFTTISE